MAKNDERQNGAQALQTIALVVIAIVLVLWFAGQQPAAAAPANDTGNGDGEGLVEPTAMPTAVPPTEVPAPTEAAPVQPTAIPPAPVGSQSNAGGQAEEWVVYESEGGVPYNGTTWNVDVAPDEIEVLTAGPACIFGVCLPGGTTRGSVIILLPATDVVIHYEVTGLIAGSNWHASYRPLGDPAAEATWRSLAENRVAAMMEAPNCTPGTGCLVLDVLVVGPDGVVSQWVVGE